MSKFFANKKNFPGEILTPNLFSGVKGKDKGYVASPSKYKIDYVYVDTEEELEPFYLAGYGIRMSSSSYPIPVLTPHSKIKLAHGVTPSSIGVKKSSMLSVRVNMKRLIEESHLDKDTTAKSRREQALLRIHLCSGKKSAECTICGHEFPVDFLVAAHIKKRAKCTKAEKLDFDNVATLMCKSGCDDLFEKGYIYVSGGAIYKNATRDTTAILDKVISELAGNIVPNWSESKKYYGWQEKNIAK